MSEKYPDMRICPPSVPRLCVDLYPRYAWKSARFHSGLEPVLMYGPPAERAQHYNFESVTLVGSSPPGVLTVFQIGLQYLATMDHHRKESLYD
jgi:hypothetical protein